MLIKYFLTQVQSFNGNIKKKNFPFPINSVVSNNNEETNKHINWLCIYGLCFVSEIDIS